MKRRWISFWCIALAFAALLQVTAAQQTQTPEQKAAPPVPPNMSRVTIEVSGGENDTPIENASVYLKYIQERKIRKDRKIELNVKTNREGAAHIPDAPLGRALLQVVADGWKPYGRWYDITDAKQVIKIRLEKPPKWY